MSYLIAVLSLIVVAQGAALLVLARARRTACRRAAEHSRRRAEAGAVAHDLNNLLAVIINYASFVQDDLARDDARRGDVGEIRRAAQQAGVLSHTLLALSSEEPGGRERAQDAPARLGQAPPKRRAVSPSQPFAAE